MERSNSPFNVDLGGQISHDKCINCPHLCQLPNMISILAIMKSIKLVAGQGQQRNRLQRNLKTVERKFPSGYFNSVYSCLHFLFPVVLAHFLLCHSYGSFSTIVPLLKRDTVRCRDNIQSVGSHPRISLRNSQERKNRQKNDRDRETMKRRELITAHFCNKCKMKQHPAKVWLVRSLASRWQLWLGWVCYTRPQV